MTMLIRTLTAVAAGTMLATGAFAQSASEIRGGSPYAAIENEPAPRLIVDPPLPEPLAKGIFQAQYRVENLRIVPVFGAGPSRSLHASGICTSPSTTCPGGGRTRATTIRSDVAGLPPGEHKVKIELVDANHNVFPGQAVTVTFTVPARNGSLTRGILTTRRGPHCPQAPSSQSAASVRAPQAEPVLRLVQGTALHEPQVRSAASIGSGLVADADFLRSSMPPVTREHGASEKAARGPDFLIKERNHDD